MKKSMIAMGLMFALASGSALAQESNECRSETEQLMNIVQLTEPVPSGQAVAFLLQLDKESPVWEELRQAEPEQYGAILNRHAPEGLRFDDDSARNLVGSSFEELPLIIAHVCQDKPKWSIIEAIEILNNIEGIKNAAPDSTLEEILVIEEPATPTVHP